MVAPATRWCCFMQQGASWFSETSLAIKSCCCLMCLQHSQMLLSLSPSWFWGLGCPSDLHPNTPPCRSDGHPFSTLRKRCRHVGLKMRDLNPTAARLGTLQELRGADLSTRTVTSRRQGTQTLHFPPVPHGYREGSGSCPGADAHRQHLSQPGEFHQGLIHPQHPASPSGFTLPDCIPHPTPITAGGAAGATTPHRWLQPGPLGQRGQQVSHAMLAASHAPARPAQWPGSLCCLLLTANSQVFLVL